MKKIWLIKLFFLLSCTLHAASITEDGQLKPAAQELVALFDFQTDSLQELSLLLEKKWLQAHIDCWNMDHRFEENYDSGFALLQELGFTNEVRAANDHYDYALVLGATKSVMEERLDFLYEEYLRGVRFDTIVLLSGARDLDPEIETYPEGLKTEYELLIYLFDRHPLKQLVPYVAIDSPKQLLENGTLRRPTTASTITDWLKTRPAAGSCLAVSNQPFVNYQEAVLCCLLPAPFKVEVIGPNETRKYPLAIYLDLFAKQLKYEQEMLLK